MVDQRDLFLLSDDELLVEIGRELDRACVQLRNWEGVASALSRSASKTVEIG